MNSGRRVRARESEKRKKRSKQQLIKKTVVDVVPSQTTSTSSSGAVRSDTKQSRHNRHLLQREQEHCQLQHMMLYFDALDQKKLDFARVNLCLNGEYKSTSISNSESAL